MKAVVYQDMYEHEQTHWWYRVRRKLATDLIKKYSLKDTDTKILDIGCGTGALMKELSSKGEVAGVDFSNESIQFCKQRGLQNVTQGSITELPFSDDTFDVILALDILEHVENEKLAVTEIKRVLKPGGKAILFVPAFMMLWGSTDEVSHHFRRYRKGHLKKLFKSSGLNIERLTYFNFILFIPILLVRSIVRLFGVSFINEYRPGTGFFNQVMYNIFNFERWLLSFLNFPFGVSIMIVSSK